MIYSRKYSRNFVPLKQDDESYNLDFRPSLGRCVIEIKDGNGKINLYTQGLKTNTDYHLELIGLNGDDIKTASLGSFNVDEYGKGDFIKKFNPDDLDNNNSKIEDFNIISVMIKKGNNINSALVGYVGNEVDWQNKYMANCVPSNNECSCNTPDDYNNDESMKDENLSEIEQGLKDKEEGLDEKQQGLIDKKKGIIEKEKNKFKPKKPLEDYERELNGKLDGLEEKEQGLLEREQGLLEREKALREGNLPQDNTEIRQKELELIKREMNLIKCEQELINREKRLIRKNPTSEKERGLIEKEKGILQLEQGLLEREKGLVEKEKGLIELEKGLRKQRDCKENKNCDYDNSNDKHNNFKDLLDKLRQNILNIENMDSKEENKNILYIKNKNAVMTPFKESNLSWYRISPNDLTGIIENSLEFTNNPFVVISHKKYKHLMLGIENEDEKEIYTLAIPCQYKKDFNIKTFENFVPVDSEVSSQNIQEGEYGYRLIKL